MGNRFDQIPTFLGYSEGEIGVVAGGGFGGYAAVVLHEPTEKEFHRVVNDLEYESPDPKGIGLNYDSVATITISGLLKWTNWNLCRAPQGRQDVRETGLVRIEIFDTDDLRDLVEERSELFKVLGIKFVG